MQIKRWVLGSLSSLTLVGCAGEAVKNQAEEASTPVVTNTSAQLVPLSIQPSTQLESVAQSTAPKVTTVKSGSFASGEHPTQGTVRIVSQDGKFFLELDREFKTSSMGPDLVVILHRSSDVLGSTKPPSYALKPGEYVLVAPLQKFSGAQRYALPAAVNPATYQSAAIWCRRFNATFGAARLSQ